MIWNLDLPVRFKAQRHNSFLKIMKIFLCNFSVPFSFCCSRFWELPPDLTMIRRQLTPPSFSSSTSSKMSQNLAGILTSTTRIRIIEIRDKIYETFHGLFFLHFNLFDTVDNEYYWIQAADSGFRSNNDNNSPTATAQIWSNLQWIYFDIFKWGGILGLFLFISNTNLTEVRFKLSLSEKQANTLMTWLPPRPYFDIFAQIIQWPMNYSSKL